MPERPLGPSISKLTQAGGKVHHRLRPMAPRGQSGAHITSPTCSAARPHRVTTLKISPEGCRNRRDAGIKADRSAIGFRCRCAHGMVRSALNRSLPMTTRRAACSCGQLHLAIEGEPCASQCATASSASGAPEPCSATKRALPASGSPSPARRRSGRARPQAAMR